MSNTAKCRGLDSKAITGRAGFFRVAAERRLLVILGATRACVPCGKAYLTAPKPVKPSASADSVRDTTVGGPVWARMRSPLTLPRVSTLVSGPARSVLRGAGWRGHVLYGLLAPAWLGIELH